MEFHTCCVRIKYFQRWRGWQCFPDFLECRVLAVPPCEGFIFFSEVGKGCDKPPKKLVILGIYESREHYEVWEIYESHKLS